VSRARGLALVALAASLGAAGGPGSLLAQEGEPRRIFGVEATPLGALPPLALPMPASRNHNYFAFRAQTGIRRGRESGELTAFAGGVDLQWRGGSIFGVTAGYQMQECDAEAAVPCDDRHTFFGARARFNVVTGGPTVATLFGDYSATSTLGAEIGVGYARGAAPDFNPCTLDVGLPLSVAMLQTVRLVAFVMPSGSIDLNCGSGTDKHKDLILNAGIGVQQLWSRGLDVHLGLQRIVRDGTGLQFGLSVMYVHLP
jgi:hypothetical protein